MKSRGFKFNLDDAMPEILEGDMISYEWNSLFIKIGKLGGGAHGSVYHATTLNGKKHIVVKVTDLTGKEKTDSYNQQEPLNLKEYSEIEHPNIMKYITWFQDAIGSIITISEYREGKNLENFVKDFYKEKPGELIPEQSIYKIFG